MVFNVRESVSVSLLTSALPKTRRFSVSNAKRVLTEIHFFARAFIANAVVSSECANETGVDASK